MAKLISGGYLWESRSSFSCVGCLAGHILLPRLELTWSRRHMALVRSSVGPVFRAIPSCFIMGIQPHPGWTEIGSSSTLFTPSLEEKDGIGFFCWYCIWLMVKTTNQVCLSHSKVSHWWIEPSMFFLKTSGPWKSLSHKTSVLHSLGRVPNLRKACLGTKKMGLFKIGHPIPSTGSVQHDLFQWLNGFTFGVNILAMFVYIFGQNQNFFWLNLVKSSLDAIASRFKDQSRGNFSILLSQPFTYLPLSTIIYLLSIQLATYLSSYLPTYLTMYLYVYLIIYLDTALQSSACIWIEKWMKIPQKLFPQIFSRGKLSRRS